MTVRFFLPKCHKTLASCTTIRICLCKSFKELFLQRSPEHCSSKAGAKVSTFLIPAKYFKEKFKETIVFYTLVDVNQA